MRPLHIASGVKAFDTGNLFGGNNTVSYLWVNTVNNLSHQSGWYAVPNFLTGRRINLKLTVGF
jgi:hypothetical protein